MNAKGRRYLLLLLISIAIRTFFYFFRFEGTFFEPITKLHILYDVIFGGVMISVLAALRDRKWLIGLTWIYLIAGIAFSVLEWVQDQYSPFTRHQYASANIPLGFVMIIFYLCLFFARKSPARIFFRCMTAVTSLPYIYGFLTIIFHLPGPASWLVSPAGIAILSILLNVLLGIAVMRTPELRRPQYADFLQ